MPNHPIGLRELLNHIFCATFGQPLVAASEQELEPIRDSIAKLRRCYKANTPEAAYSDSSARQAYMLAYYPYYIQPAMKIFSEIILKEPKIAAANELNLSFMAGGPCSEAIGVTEALQRNGKKCPVNITILDRELGWKDQHGQYRITYSKQQKGAMLYDIKRQPPDRHSGLLQRMVFQPPEGGLCGGNKPLQHPAGQPHPPHPEGRGLHRLLDEKPRPDACAPR